MEKFGRNYRIVFEIGHRGGNMTDLIPEENIEVKYPFTCKFTTSANITQSNCGKCQMQLLNLPEDVQKKLYKDNYNAKKYILMWFYAGYQNEIPLIFNGFITQCYSYRESGAVDFITDIQADSNALITIYGFNNVTITKDTRFEDVVKILTEQFPWYKPRYITPKIRPLAKNKTFIGQTLDLLGKEYGQYDIFIDNGDLNVLDKNEVIPADSILVITSESGLLGSPRRAEQFLKFDMVFEPRLKLAQAIELRSYSIPWFNQLYKVYGIEHKGVISPRECGKVVTTVTLFLGDDPFEYLREQSGQQTGVSSGDWQNPLKAPYQISGRFGEPRYKSGHFDHYHKGVDMATSLGTPVYAAANGTVSTAYNEPNGYGNVIYVNNGKNASGKLLTSRYAHLRNLILPVGTKVFKGETIIGYAGNTGYSSGAHLHFEIRENGNAINPAQYVKGL